MKTVCSSVLRRSCQFKRVLKSVETKNTRFFSSLDSVLQVDSKKDSVIDDKKIIGLEANCVNEIEDIKQEIENFESQQGKSNETVGVFKECESEDVKLLVNNFTAPALAQALRDRDTILRQAAFFAHQGKQEQLQELLKPFLKDSIQKRRDRKYGLDLSKGFTRNALVIVQRQLHRMPRQVYHAGQRRASVVIPLCNVKGVASILFERRSSTVRFGNQVCFPGGMLDEGVDSTIIQTSLREMEEELGISHDLIEVLGILRCNWNAVSHMTGIDVTPVVGFIGELTQITLAPNTDEVGEYFTVPVENLLDEHKWLHRQFSTPVFTGGPHIIWGLTAYLLERFVKDILLKSIPVEPETSTS